MRKKSLSRLKGFGTNLKNGKGDIAIITITKDQEVIIKPLVQQIIDTLGITFGDITIDVQNRHMHSIQVNIKILMDKNGNK